MDRRAFVGLAASTSAAAGASRIGRDAESLASGTEVAPSIAAYNVLDYAPNGVVINTGVADATSAWRRAREAAVAAGGGIIFAPPGTYLVDELAFSFDGLIVLGAGKGRTILKARAAGQYVIRWALSFGRLADLTIDGNDLRGTRGLGLVPMREDGSGPVVNQNWNLVQNVEVRRCDEGFVLRAGPAGRAHSGCWYNSFVACEAGDCIRGLWLRAPTGAGGSQCNVNAFYSFRAGNRGAGRSNTGVQIDSGSGNSFFHLSCEGILAGRSPNNPPTGLWVGQFDPVSRFENHYNKVFAYNPEACTRSLYNDNTTLEIHGSVLLASQTAGQHPQGALYLAGAAAALPGAHHATIPLPQWTEPRLVNSWVNYGSGYEPAGYYKDAVGRVHLRGIIKNGRLAAGTVLFTLPRGFRPSAIGIYAVNRGGTYAAVQVMTNGEVQLAINLSSPSDLSLSGISFRAG